MLILNNCANPPPAKVYHHMIMPIMLILSNYANPPPVNACYYLQLRRATLNPPTIIFCFAAVTLLLCITLSLLQYIIIDANRVPGLLGVASALVRNEPLVRDWFCKGRLFPQKWRNFPKKNSRGQGWMWWLFPTENSFFFADFLFFCMDICFFETREEVFSKVV